MQVERRKSDIGCQRSDIINAMNYEDLEVYKRASNLFPLIYKLVRSWKQIDQRELGSQMIRAANSIHANIAEGVNKSPQEFKRYLTSAIGSCDELVSHLKDASNIGLLNEEAKSELVSDYSVIVKQL